MAGRRRRVTNLERWLFGIVIGFVLGQVLLIVAQALVAVIDQWKHERNAGGDGGR
jgi:hypothetical protein